jgi:predicted RNA-binding protein Jag
MALPSCPERCRRIHFSLRPVRAILQPIMDHAVITDALRRLLTELELPFSDITVSQENDILRVDIQSDKPSRIIGWHGETLNSLQHLIKSIVRSLGKLDRSPFLVLDTDSYRRMQEEKVRKVAEQKADFVRRTGNRVALSPMSPYFRRIVHLHVTNTSALQDLTTESVGEGEYRQVVLRLKEENGIKSGEELSPVIESKQDGLENLDI